MKANALTAAPTYSSPPEMSSRYSLDEIKELMQSYAPTALSITQALALLQMQVAALQRAIEEIHNVKLGTHIGRLSEPR